MSSPVSGPSTVWNILGASDSVTAVASPFNTAAATATGTAGTADIGASSTAAVSSKTSGAWKIAPVPSKVLCGLGGVILLIALM